MGRSPQQENWEPITARISPDSTKRLRVTAARRGVTTGVILDELIQAMLPADRLPPFNPSSKPTAFRRTIHYLKREMVRLGLSQNVLSQKLKLSQKAVNHWFQKGHVPEARWDSIMEVLAAIQAERSEK